MPDSIRSVGVDAGVSGGRSGGGFRRLILGEVESGAEKFFAELTTSVATWEEGRVASGFGVEDAERGTFGTSLQVSAQAG